MSYSLPYYGQDFNSLPQYKFGDWIKDNKQGVMGGLKTAAGIGAMFVPGLQGVGLGLIGKGVGDIGSEITGDINDRKNAKSIAQNEEAQARGELEQQNYLNELQRMQDEKLEADRGLFEEQQAAMKASEEARLQEEARRKGEMEVANVQNSNINQRIQGEAVGSQYSFKYGGGLNKCAYGGPIINNYAKGQTHSGINGGIPVDENGTPSVMSKTKPVGLTEMDELTYNGYVFSNSIPYKNKIKK